MKKIRKTGKKLLSYILTVTMVLSSVVFFNVGAAALETSAIKVESRANGDPVYFYVPEQIYLKPTVTSMKEQQRYSFQWFADAVVDPETHQITSLRSGENSSGNFYFYYEYADSISVSYKYVDENFNDIVAYQDVLSISQKDYVNRNSVLMFSDSDLKFFPYNTGSDSVHTKYTVNSNTINTQIIRTDSLSPYLNAETNEVYIEWLVRFTDTRDLNDDGTPIIKTTKAYTCLYKPYIAPVGNAQRTKNSRGQSSYGSSISWISGVHGVEAEGAYYANSGTSYGLIPFSSSDTNGTLVPPSSGKGVAENGRLYSMMPDNFYHFGFSKENCDKWINSLTSENLTEKTINYYSNTKDASSSGDNAYYNVGTAPTAVITVDASRYTNFNTIPNFTAGIMATDNEGSKNSGAYYVGDVTGRTAENNVSDFQKNETSDGESYWNNVNTDNLSVLYGTYASWGDNAAVEGVKYNGRWNRAISVPNTTENQNYKVKTAFFNHDDDNDKHYGQDTIWNFSIIPITATVTNKSALRAAYEAARAKFPQISINEDGSCQFYDDTMQCYKDFIALFKAAGLLISSLNKTSVTATNGATYTIDTLPQALNEAVANVENARFSSSAKVRFVALRRNADGNYITSEVYQGRDKITDETASYNYFDGVTILPPEFSGYQFVGYTLGASTSYNVNIGSNYESIIKTDDKIGESFVQDDNLAYTLYYFPQELSLTVDTEGGTFNYLRAQTGRIPDFVGDITFPTYNDAEAPVNYTVKDNNVLMKTTDASISRASQFVPLFANLKADTGFTFTYSVQGANASDVKLSLVSDRFLTVYNIGADGTFKTNINDSGAAYLKVTISGSACTGKEFRISDLCLAATEENALYFETSTDYPAEYTAPKEIKQDMNYSTDGLNSVTVTSRFRTSTYSQRQLLPYYIDLIPGCTYRFDYSLSGLEQSAVQIEFISSATQNVYQISESGSTFTVAEEDNGKAQMKVTFTNVTVIGQYATLENLFVDCIDSDISIDGNTHEVYSLGIPVKKNCSFTGWTGTALDGSEMYGTLSAYDNSKTCEYTFGVNKDILKATWGTEKYTVVFRNYDGSVYSTQEVEKGGSAVAPNITPERFGYTFVEWDTDYTNVQNNLYIEPVYQQVDITVNLNKSSLTVYQNASGTVSASFLPNEPEISDVVWSTSNADIAIVEGSGAKNSSATVTGVASGSAVITATVTYDGREYSSSVDVTVNKLIPTAIEFSKEATANTCFVGDTYSPDGLELKITYNDGSVKYYDYGTTYEGISITSSITTSTAGKKLCSVSFTAGGTTVKKSMLVTVNEILVDKIEIQTLPLKKSYLTGETANYSGLSILVTYNNGDTEIITTGYTCTGFDSETAGDKTITVSYGGKTADFTVNVQYGPADYSAVESAKTRWNNVSNKEIYTDASVALVTKAIGDVVTGKKIDEQDAVNAMAKAINDAIDSLVEKELDLTTYNAAVRRIPEDLTKYTSESVDAMNNAKTAVDNFKTANNKITKQTEFEVFVKEFDESITALIENVTESFEFINGAKTTTKSGVKYVYDLKAGLSKTKLKSYISNENTTYKVDTANGSNVGTGSIITVSNSKGEQIDQYVVIIYGDVDGNAKINSDDYNMIVNALSGEGESLSGVAKYAANVSGSTSTVNQQDYDLIADVAAGMAEINQAKAVK